MGRPFMKNKILSQSGLYTVIDLPSTKLQGCKTIIDTEDYSKVEHYHWFANIAENRARVKSTQGLYMARIIMNPPDDMEVDHKDGNPFINCKHNLRICTHAQNSCNRHHISTKGISKFGKKYKAEIKHNGESTYLGLYTDKSEALKAYNAAALILFGEFACLNEVN